MALATMKPSRTPVKWLLLFFLPLLLSFGGVLAAPARISYKVIGSDVTRAGTNTSLGCYPAQSGVGSAALPFFNWYKDGKGIPHKTGSVLRLYHVTKQDEAYYQCGGPGPFTNETGLYLHVFAPSDVLPQPSVYSDKFAVEGRPLSLTCHMRYYVVNDKTVFTWYKDSTEVEGQTGQVLQLPPLTEADEGKYTCTVREGPVNSTSPPSLGLHVSLMVSPNVTIETPSPDAVVKGILGNTLSLTCKVIRANPRVPADGYSWSYLPSPQGQLRPLIEKTRTLTLGPLTREDRGQYFCQARNDRDLEHLNLIGNASVTVDVVYLKSFSMTPDLEIIEGDPVTLTCRVDSHPTARLAWTVNGQEVRHVTDNVDHYVILSAACSDSNNYTCGASNTDLPGLEINATVQLTVLCRQATDLPPELGVTKSDETPWRLIAAVTSAFLSLSTVVVITLVLCWCRLTNSQQKHPLDQIFCYLSPAGSPTSERVHANEKTQLLDTHTNSPDPNKSLKLKQKICFDDVYQDGKVYIISPEDDSEMQHKMEKNVPVDKRRLLKDGEAKRLFVKALKRSLERTVRPEDPPVFIFSNHPHDIKLCTVFHTSYGVIIMYVEFDGEKALPNLEATMKKLLRHKKDQELELTNKLNPQDVLIVLVLPNLSTSNLHRKIKEKLQKKEIQVLCGNEEADVTAWLQELDADKQPWAMKRAESNKEAFKRVVKSYLALENYSANADPPNLPATVEQMSVLQCLDNLLHVWGPPGSGKTSLFLDRVQWWLSSGEMVLLVVCDPSYEPHLHRLASLAVSNLQKKSAEKRLLLCTNATEEAIQSQMKKCKSTKICIAMDNIDADILTEFLQLNENYGLKSLCTTGHEDIRQEDIQKFRAMGGRSFHLSNSFRCTDAILELAKEFHPSQTSTGNLNTLPCLSDRPSVPVKVAYHPRHPAYRAKVPDCGDCQTWLRSSLSPLGDGLNKEDERWKSMVVLLTGDWGSNTNAKEVLCDQLRRQGVPAVLHRKLNSQVSSRPTFLTWSQVKPGKAAELQRVEIGVDTKGHPAVHMIPATHFRGQEKPCVLVVHYDWRDDHADHQSQEERDARLWEHGQQLHLAVTRCQTELAVLLLSPSPAAAPLLKHTSGGEQNPTTMIVEMEV